VENWVKGVLAYTALSFALASSIDYAFASTADTAPWAALAWGFLRMYTPTLSALLVALLIDRGGSVLEALGLRMAGGRVVVWYLLAPLLVLPPLALCLLFEALLGKLDLAGLSASLGPVRLDPLVVLSLSILAGYFAAVTVNALFALGEEVGWRGYLYHALLPRLGYYKTVLAVGILWGFWHATAILWLGHNYPVHRVEGALLSPLLTVLLTLPMFYLREISGSVLPAASFHGAVNAWWALTVLAAPTLGDVEGGVGAVGILSWALYALIYALSKKKKNALK